MESHLRGTTMALPYCAQCAAAVIAFQSATSVRRSTMLSSQSTFKTAMNSMLSSNSVCAGSSLSLCDTAVSTLTTGAYYPVIAKYAMQCKVHNGNATAVKTPCPATAVCAGASTGAVTFNICDVDPKNKLVA